MKTRALVSLMFCLAALQAVADEGYARPEWGGRGPYLAQLSPEERRALRERWEHMPPEERAALREQFREHVQNLPPEERERHRQEIMQRWRELPAEERAARWREWQERRGAHDYGPAYEPQERRFEGFGRGYEQRGPRNGPPGRR